MKKYSTLLFDVDDTILDFKKGEEQALNDLFDELKVDNKDKVIEDFKIINTGLWRDLEKGLVCRDFVLNERFKILFDRYNKVVDGKQIEDKYRYYLNMQHQCIEGAHDVLETLYPYYELYIITNGVSETQYKRLKDAKLERYFKKIFVSEELGFQKPMKEYFNGVVKQIPNFNTSTSLVIGDSLSADILGGLQFNIDTCWFNPNRKKNTTDIRPTYELHDLSDLYEILNQDYLQESLGSY